MNEEEEQEALLMLEGILNEFCEELQALRGGWNEIHRKFCQMKEETP
jgi:hypothetical protein